MNDKGERFFRYWSWFGIGSFVVVVSTLYYLRMKINLDDAISLLIIGLIFALLLFLTGIFKILWEYVEDEKEAIEEEPDSNLELEYKELTEAIRHRGNQYLTLESILISGAVVAVAALIGTSDPEGMRSFVAKGTLVVAFSMVAIGWIFHFTTSNLDKIYWKRVHIIEKQLGIQGHHKLYTEKIEKQLWFKLRKKSWTIIYAMLTFMFLLGLAYSFNIIDFPFF